MSAAANITALTAVPTLDDLIARPSLAASLPVDAAEALFAQASTRLAADQAARDALLVRLAAGSSPASAVSESRTLDADGIAAMLGVTRRWVFRHADELPFIRRISKRSLVCNERDLRRWRELQKA